MYLGSTAVCVSRVHVFNKNTLKTPGAQNVYPGSTAVFVSWVHMQDYILGPIMCIQGLQ